MKYYILLPLLCSFASVSHASVVFSDDFNRTLLGPTYLTTVSAGDGGSLIKGSSFLELTNDSTGAANANGRVSVATPFSNFDAPFTGILSANAGTVTWETNFRYNRTPLAEPSGFGGGKYAAAVVLAGSQFDFTGGKGYAVVYGSAGAPDPIRLVSYSGGLVADANLTDLIASPSNNLSGYSNYASLRVTYTASTGRWELFVRDDGATAWADPATLDAASLVGVSSNSAYTSDSLTHAGFLWNSATAAGQTAQFDNFRVSLGSASAVPEPAWGASLLGALCLAVSARRRRLRR